MHHLSIVKRDSANSVAMAVLTSGRMHYLKNRAVMRYIRQMEEFCRQDVERWEDWKANPEGELV
jgi:hypothetical protein